MAEIDVYLENLYEDLQGSKCLVMKITKLLLQFPQFMKFALVWNYSIFIYFITKVARHNLSCTISTIPFKVFGSFTKTTRVVKDYMNLYGTFNPLWYNKSPDKKIAIIFKSRVIPGRGCIYHNHTFQNAAFWLPP